MRILVLEDDENLRELLCETLSDEGYQVCGAANGLSALEAVRQSTFELLLLDVRMEGMTGLETFASMRQRGLELACLVITGYATEEDSIRAIRLGVGDYLRKPFEMHELLMRVERLAALHQRQREARQRESKLRELLAWLGSQLFCEKALDKARRVQQIAAALQLQSEQSAELEMAAAFLAGGPSCPLSEGPANLIEALELWEERWDGRGPRGLAGEEIPLGARILALAFCTPEERKSGRVDPHLLFALDLITDEDQQRHYRALLEVARGLLHMGRHQEALALLEQASEKTEGPQRIEAQLLLAGLEARPLRLSRLKNLLSEAEQWGPSALAEVQLQAASLLMESDREQAVVWLRQAAPVLRGDSKALCQLALWVGSQAPPHWSPVESLNRLLEPASESRLLGALGWLGTPLLSEGLRQPDERSFEKAWRQCAGALVPALVRLTAEQRASLFQRTQNSPHGTPSSWLQVLAQDGDEGLKRSARQAQTRPASRRLPPLHLCSFGTFQVRVQGKVIAEPAFRGQRNRWLLAYLAGSPRLLPEERVRDLFWPEELERGRKGLSNCLFYLRRALRPEGAPADLDYFTRSEVLLGLDPQWEPWHDLWEVEAILSRLKSCEPRALVDEVDRLLALTPAPYLDGCYHDWAVERREQLQLELIQGLLFASQRAAESTLWASVADWTHRLLQWEPTHQPAAVLRAQALCQLRRPEEALRTVEQITRALRQEFDLEPGTELLEWATRARYECF